MAFLPNNFRKAVAARAQYILRAFQVAVEVVLFYVFNRNFMKYIIMINIEITK
jgi:hypothetical protein